MSSSSSSGVEYEFVSHASVRDVGEAEYRSLLTEATPPFLHFEWLDALEQCGCVSPETGWLPQLLALYRKQKGQRQLLAVAPAYVKGHSDGEFVFDHGWAQFAEDRLGLAYYPKLILAVPFTPATGPKVLVHPREDVESTLVIVDQGIKQMLQRLSLSSAHVLFPPLEEADRFVGRGWARRLGVQFHWENAGYESFEDFLARFSAKRRAAVRRERRALVEDGIDLEVHTGGDITEAVVDAAHEFYAATVDKFFWGRRYLNREFFFRVAETMPDRLHLIMAREKISGHLVGGAFNLLGQDALYGRYWGSLEERRFLHFNVCYYAGIEECIARGLSRFEPGAGGEHKLSRGFDATLTQSAHWISDAELDAAVRDFLQRETSAVLRSVESARRESVLRHQRDKNL